MKRTGDSIIGLAQSVFPKTYHDGKTGILTSATYIRTEFDLINCVLVGHYAGGKIKQLKSVVGLAAITDIVQYAAGSTRSQSGSVLHTRCAKR